MYISDSLKAFRNCTRLIPFESLKKGEFLKAFQSCMNNTIPIKTTTFEYFNMGRLGEKKCFLPLSEEYYKKEKCFWLTVGVGGDSNVEKEFKTKYLKCLVYGVEPSEDQYAKFENYGTIIPHGIGKTEERG